MNATESLKDGLDRSSYIVFVDYRYNDGEQVDQFVLQEKYKANKRGKIYPFVVVTNADMDQSYGNLNYNEWKKAKSTKELLRPIFDRVKEGTPETIKGEEKGKKGKKENKNKKQESAELETSPEPKQFTLVNWEGRAVEALVESVQEGVVKGKLSSNNQSFELDLEELSEESKNQLLSYFSPQ